MISTAPSTTWLLVKTSPWESIITPVPLPKLEKRLPKKSLLTTSDTTDTTAGRTRSTVSATLGSCSIKMGVGGTGVAGGVLVGAGWAVAVGDRVAAGVGMGTTVGVAGTGAGVDVAAGGAVVGDGAVVSVGPALSQALRTSEKSAIKPRIGNMRRWLNPSPLLPDRLEIRCFLGELGMQPHISSY